MSTPVQRDERTVSIENAGYRLSYLVLSFGLLVAIAVRSFRDDESSWDLFALIILSGALNAGYLRYHRASYRQRTVLAAVAMIGGALVAAAIALLHHRRG